MSSAAEGALPHFATIGLEQIGHVLRVTIDRPGDDLNRVDATLHADLTALFAWLAGYEGARAVLLTGAGRAFSAGGDFDWFPELQDPEALRHLGVDAKAMIWDLLDVRPPIVCALNGHAVGLGASIALLCDAVLMADDATIADPHVRVGLVAGDGGTIAWPLLLGPMAAKRYLLTGDPVDAAEAYRIGLVTAVVPAASLDADASAMAEKLAAGAPLAIQHTKAAVNGWIKTTATAAFEQAAAAELETFTSADHREALAAAAERRPPRFTGR